MLAGNVSLSFGAWFVRLADVGPVASAFWRLVMAAPLLIAVSLALGWHPRQLTRRWLVALVIGGLCFAADLAAWHLGILRTTLTNATLFGNSTVLFFPVWGFIAARALPSRMQALALVLAAVGGALLMGKSYQLDMRNLAGDLMCLIAGFLYTCYFISISRVRSEMAALPTLAVVTAIAALPLPFVASALGEQVWPQSWWPLIGLTLLSQVVGQSLLIYALGKLSPLVIGLGILVQPVIGALIGWSVYNEHLGVVDMIGAVLVTAALVLVRTPDKSAPLATDAT